MKILSENANSKKKMKSLAFASIESQVQIKTQFPNICHMSQAYTYDNEQLAMGIGELD